MHFYIKILCGQSWLFSFLSFYSQFLTGLGDGECIHRILGFAAGYLTPSSGVLLKKSFFFSSFSVELLQSSLEEDGASLERPASQFEKHCFGEREKIHDFKRDKHSQSNWSRP